MLAWFGLMSIAGVVIAGPVADKFGSRKPILVTFLIRTILFLLIFFEKTALSFYIFSLMFGFSLFITAPITTILVRKKFGHANIGIISGFITTLHHLSGGASAYFGGVVFDKIGDYQVIIIVSMVLATTAALSSLLIRENREVS